jgi:hypothetical protein
MTRTAKFTIASAAIAGLIAGSSIGIRASNLLPGVRSFNSQQDEPKRPKKDPGGGVKDKDETVRERHACKGQNSCRGKGGCKSSDNGCKGKNTCKGKGGCSSEGSEMP